MHYRKYLLFKLISAVEAKEYFTPTLLDCLYLLRLAWENVSAQTITNCFRHCGFTEEETSEGDEDEDPSSVGSALLTRLSSHGVELPEDVSFQQFVSVDNQAITSSELTIEDIATTVLNQSQEPENEGEEDNSQLPCPPPTSRETEQALLIVRHYFKVKDSAEKELQLVSKLQRSVTDCAIHSCRQSSIKYFLCK